MKTEVEKSIEGGNTKALLDLAALAEKAASTPIAPDMMKANMSNDNFRELAKEGREAATKQSAELRLRNLSKACSDFVKHCKRASDSSSKGEVAPFVQDLANAVSECANHSDKLSEEASEELKQASSVCGLLQHSFVTCNREDRD